MSISQYSNTEGIKSEIQLADSGYGQGQILINPLHLASIYSAFSNDGNIIEPTLLYNPNYNPNIWMPEVIQKESIHTVLETMKKVISEPTFIVTYFIDDNDVDLHRITDILKGELNQESILIEYNNVGELY